MRSARLSAPLLRCACLFVCFALLLTTLSLVSINPVLAKRPITIRQNNQQVNRAAKKVAPVPPQPGAPVLNLPNLDEVRQRSAEPPRAAEPIPSTMRSRHKPIESRHGRKVGDPLPPKQKASIDGFRGGSEQVRIAGVGRRGSVGTVRSHHAAWKRGLLAPVFAPQSGGGPQSVIWTSVVGVTASGNSLTKTAGDYWGNAGAVSTQAIVSGDGYVELIASETNTWRMCGLSNGDSDQNYPDIDFALYLTNSSQLQIYESGAYRGAFGNYSTGDHLRVAIEGGVVKYSRNGTVFYTSATAPTYPLLVDTSLYSNGSTINNVVISGNFNSNAQNVTWTNVVGVTASGNSLTKTAGDYWGNAGAVSTQAIVSGDGYVELIASETNTWRMCGLSNGDSDQNYPDIDFALYLTNSSQLQIYESGAYRGAFGNYSTGDHLRVAIEGGVVKYSRNGVVFYTSAIAPTYPLLVDTSLYSNGSTINNVVISSGSGGGATSTSDQFVQNFLQWGLSRTPGTDESNYWRDILRSAYPQGQSSVLMAMTEFGVTVFESAEYGARNRSNHDYVYDLYRTYLMRDPTQDQDGWNFWTGRCNTYGREAVRQGFEDSDEFHRIVANLAASGAASSNAASLATAQVDPFNQSGNQIEARDCEWSVPLISLPGRAGLDFGLSVSYSSLVWTRSGPYVYFDQDYESLSPGFTIGFPTVQFRKFDAQTGRNVYVFTAAGRHSELRQAGTSNVYEASDSSYLQLIESSGSLLVRTTDGTQMSYTKLLTGWRLTQIEDRNGNIITVNNDWRGDIQNITDTLGRTITFNYDNNANLTSITQSWAGQSHTWATFGWGTVTMQPSFSSEIVGISSGEVIPALTQVGLNDGSRYNFEYTGAGQVNVIRRYTSDNVQRSYTAYDYQGNSDCPRIYQARVWAENWSDVNGVPHEVITQFSDNGDGSHQMTATDGTAYKEFYCSASCQLAWQRGLVTQTEIWSGGARQKWTATAYTQDNTSVNYQTNPRVTETNIYDAGGNRRRTTVDYSVAAYAQYGLPFFVSEYAANGTTEIRRTYTDYNLSQPYLDSRIIGLVSARHLFDPVTGQWQAKTTYGYDDSSRLTAQATSASMHDQSYDTSRTIRGNVTSVSRWDATDPGNATKALTSFMNYNAAGSVLSTTDAAGHTSSIGYADSFSDGNNSRSTFAYATTLTDADGYQSFVQYNFDFAAKTRVQGPPPNNQANGIIQTFTYDAAARIQQVTTANTGAYTSYTYGPNYIYTFSSVNNLADEAYSIQIFDGAGRVIEPASFHPGSQGQYKAQVMQYDAMGRMVKQSNPTEVASNSVPSGDDASGWIYTQQSYDWKGRPLVTTNTDGSIKYASYAGCGCAGGEVVTLTDEVGRQQKVYSDVLGRQWKTEVLKWDGTVYATTTNTLNARDQATLVRQYQGNDQSGVYQDTTMSYDGYGRLSSKHVPEQNTGTATLYAYNNDDTIQSVTDARGAVASYGYNNRHLVNEIDYTAPAGITPTANVTFAYDAAGNRTSMTDGLGTKSYSYNSLSQLMSETRTFTGVGAFTLSYDYNLAGELRKITDATNMTINYGYDSTGRVSSVTGADSLYAGVSNYASNLQYRAWGGMKSMTDGKGYVSSLSYTTKLQPSQFDISGGAVHQNYDYFDDGRISVVHNTSDTNFDRAYTFDHVGRFSTATSGGQARNSYGDTPYSETFAYDAFSHLTTRQSDLWNGSTSVSDSGTYASNRRSGWGYDADGRITTIELRTNGFDAAGRQISMSATAVPLIGSSYTVNQALAHDGDGLLTEEVDTQSNAPGSSNTTYHLRSTPLGGEIVEELNSSGAKIRGYVSLPGGQLLASQSGNNVTWKHNTPAGTGEYTMNSSISAIGRTEFDPIGADISLSQPVNTPPGEGDGDIGAGHFAGIMDARWADFFNPNSGFVVDGHQVTAAEAMFFINFGTGNSLRDTAGMTGEAFANGVISSVGPEAFTTASSSTPISLSGVEGIPGHQTIEYQFVKDVGVIPVPTAYSGTTSIPGSIVMLASSLQPRSQDPATTVRNSIDEAERLSTKPPCIDFLSTVGVQNPEGLIDLLRNKTQLVTHPNDYSTEGTSVHAVATWPDYQVDFYHPFFTEMVPKILESGRYVNGPQPMEPKPRKLLDQGQDSLHEGIHLWTGKTDIELANLFLKNNQKPFTDKLKASQFWHDKLKQKCNGKDK